MLERATPDEALRFRCKGLTIDDIGEYFRCSPREAYQLVSDELKRLDDESSETADEARRIELERLDHIVFEMTDVLDEGGAELRDRIAAASVLVRAAECRTRLLSLDRAAAA